MVDPRLDGPRRAADDRRSTPSTERSSRKCRTSTSRCRTSSGAERPVRPPRRPRCRIGVPSCAARPPRPPRRSDRSAEARATSRRTPGRRRGRARSGRATAAGPTARPGVGPAERRHPDRLEDVEGRLVVADDRPGEIQQRAFHRRDQLRERPRLAEPAAEGQPLVLDLSRVRAIGSSVAARDAPVQRSLRFCPTGAGWGRRVNDRIETRLTARRVAGYDARRSESGKLARTVDGRPDHV